MEDFFWWNGPIPWPLRNFFRPWLGCYSSHQFGAFYSPLRRFGEFSFWRPHNFSHMKAFLRFHLFHPGGFTPLGFFWASFLGTSSPFISLLWDLTLISLDWVVSPFSVGDIYPDPGGVSPFLASIWAPRVYVFPNGPSYSSPF